MESQEAHKVLLLCEKYYDFKFDENHISGSQVTDGFRKVDVGWVYSLWGFLGSF
jgi:hypothetical protein